MPSAQGTYTLSLSCTAANGTASGSAAVLVSTTPPPLCTTRPPAYNGVPRALTPRQFTVIWGVPFPGTINQVSNGTTPGIGAAIPDGGVFAYEFIAPLASNVPSSGYFEFVFSPDFMGRGTLVTAISNCPGEVASLSAGSSSLNLCYGGPGKSSPTWTLTGTPGLCPLTPGSTYYLNVTTTDDGCKTVPAGAPANCGLRVNTRAN
jgi:hypothetical protein